MCSVGGPYLCRIISSLASPRCPLALPKTLTLTRNQQPVPELRREAPHLATLYSTLCCCVVEFVEFDSKPVSSVVFTPIIIYFVSSTFSASMLVSICCSQPVAQLNRFGSSHETHVRNYAQCTLCGDQHTFNEIPFTMILWARERERDWPQNRTWCWAECKSFSDMLDSIESMEWYTRHYIHYQHTFVWM